jgi:hypothetical protein
MQPTTPTRKRPSAIPTCVLLPSNTDQEKWFPPAPAVVTPMAADRKQQREDPNVWVPRSIEKERKNLPMSQAKGTRRSLMQPQEGAREHPFYPTLQQWGTNGVPVDCGPDWDWDVIEQAVARGPHRSALDPENAATVQEDVQYQVDAGFSQIFTWEEVQKLRPKKLKVSPMAVVPQKNRRGRIILDLSFPVYPTRTTKHA